MANVEFGTGKTVLILTIVVACFAILWPKIFYPMLIASHGGKTQADNPNGCCDVIFETDVNAIKVMTEICGTILNRHSDFNPKLVQIFNEGKLNKEIIESCRSEVKNVCGIDIAEFLHENVKLGRTYRQILDEVRSFNTSVCLRLNFGVSPGLIGTPRHMRSWVLSTSRHLRQERPLHLRPDMMHPALREKGRAIPQSHIVPKVFDKDQQPPNRAVPMPGMRPPLGGAGHVVPAPKGGGTMSIVMPLYTIGIVIFFMYTIMKVFVKKSGNGHEFQSDPDFGRVVFEDQNTSCNGDRALQQRLWKTPSDESTRLVMTAIGGLLAEVDQQLDLGRPTQYSTDPKKEDGKVEDICTDRRKDKEEDKESLVSKELVWDEHDVKGDILHEPHVDEDNDETRPKIKVLGLETVAECEGGAKWSRPVTPALGDGGHSRSTTPLPPLAHSPEPHNIFLEGTLPSSSKVLVADSETQAVTLDSVEGDTDEPPVILSGKMTLSLISLDELHHALPVQVEDELFDDAVIEDIGHRFTNIDEDDDEPADGKGTNIEDDTTNYATATMSVDAEQIAEIEETAADISNYDNLDTAEDQEEIEDEEEVEDIWNGDVEDSPIKTQTGLQHQR